MNNSRLCWRCCCGAVLRRFGRLVGEAACCLRRGGVSYSSHIRHLRGVQRFSWCAGDAW